MVLRYAIFLSNLILHSDSVCDILRSIVDISESRRVWVNTLFIKVAVCKRGLWSLTENRPLLVQL